MASKKKIQKCSRCIRISFFILNALVWVLALVAIISGLMTGFSNGTLSLDAAEDDYYEGGEIRWIDILYTTPTTLLIYYGVAMLITAIMGCFASAGGRLPCNIIFVILTLTVFIIDAALSYMFYWNPFAMKRFTELLDESMDSYGTGDNAKFGLFPHHPTAFWDHLQMTGKCCGKFSSEEWKAKVIGSKEYDYSAPDSCCTFQYDYHRCGWRIWQHLEGDMGHYRSQMLKKTGCMTIFPEEITTKYHEMWFIVFVVGIAMLVNCVLSIVLVLFYFSMKYRTGQGPEVVPHFVRWKPKINPEMKDAESASVDEDINDELIRNDRVMNKPIITKTSSTENIYKNRKFERDSELESFPVVYKRQLETKVGKVQEVNDRPLSR